MNRNKSKKTWLNAKAFFKNLPVIIIGATPNGSSAIVSIKLDSKMKRETRKGKKSREPKLKVTAVPIEQLGMKASMKKVILASVCC